MLLFLLASCPFGRSQHLAVGFPGELLDNSYCYPWCDAHSHLLHLNFTVSCMDVLSLAIFIWKPHVLASQTPGKYLYDVGGRIQDRLCSAGLEASSVIHGVWTSRWFELVGFSFFFFNFDNTGRLELWWLEADNKGFRLDCTQGLDDLKGKGRTSKT